MRYLASPAQLRGALIRWSLVTVPLVVALGFLSGMAAGSGPGNAWFDSLVKPAINPPSIVFPIVWSTLYVLMGVALALILSASGAAGRGVAVIAFAVQMVLNLAWSQVFFAAHQLTGGLIVIVLMAIAIIATIVLFARVRKSAAWLLAPYLAWVVFAGFLNWQFLQLNPNADGKQVSGATVRIAI
jgi:benzodiazapine receptor